MTSLLSQNIGKKFSFLNLNPKMCGVFLIWTSSTQNSINKKHKLFLSSKIFVNLSLQERRRLKISLVSCSISLILETWKTSRHWLISINNTFRRSLNCKLKAHKVKSCQCKSLCSFLMQGKKSWMSLAEDALWLLKILRKIFKRINYFIYQINRKIF